MCIVLGFFVEKNRSTKLLFKEVGVLNFLPDDRLFMYICSVPFEEKSSFDFVVL
jgi:hypothetical protein